MKVILVLLILFSVGVMGQVRQLSPLDVSNPFLDENYVRIRVNPATGEILSCRAKVMAVTQGNEIIEHKVIDNVYNELVEQNGDNYYKGYYKENNQYRPAIYDISKADIEVVKVF